MTTLDEQIRVLRMKIDSARDERVRAEARRDAAAATVERVEATLREEFAVADVDSARSTLAQLERQAADAVAALEKELESA